MQANCIFIDSEFVIHPSFSHILKYNFPCHCLFTCLTLRSICGTGNSSQQTSLQCLSTINMVFSAERGMGHSEWPMTQVTHWALDLWPMWPMTHGSPGPSVRHPILAQALHRFIDYPALYSGSKKLHGYSLLPGYPTGTRVPAAALLAWTWMWTRT